MIKKQNTLLGDRIDHMEVVYLKMLYLIAEYMGCCFCLFVLKKLRMEQPLTNLHLKNFYIKNQVPKENSHSGIILQASFRK